jgi:hypothetical protein
MDECLHDADFIGGIGTVSGQDNRVLFFIRSASGF